MMSYCTLYCSSCYERCLHISQWHEINKDIIYFPSYYLMTNNCIVCLKQHVALSELERLKHLTLSSDDKHINTLNKLILGSII